MHARRPRCVGALTNLANLRGCTSCSTKLPLILNLSIEIASWFATIHPLSRAFSCNLRTTISFILQLRMPSSVLFTRLLLVALSPAGAIVVLHGPESTKPASKPASGGHRLLVDLEDAPLFDDGSDLWSCDPFQPHRAPLAHGTRSSSVYACVSVLDRPSVRRPAPRPASTIQARQWDRSCLRSWARVGRSYPSRRCTRPWGCRPIRSRSRTPTCCRRRAHGNFSTSRLPWPTAGAPKDVYRRRGSSIQVARERRGKASLGADGRA